MEELVIRSHERTKAIKLSYSPDNTLAYIDFLDLTLSRDDYTGPELPLTFMWSGTGTYLCPFTINIGDPLLKSVVKLFHDQKTQKSIPEFYEKLNLLVNRISFYDFPSITFRCISAVLECIHKMNRDYLIKNKFKIYLYVYETKLNKNKSYHSSYSKKFPLNIKILKPEFESILKALIDDLRVKSAQRTHDIKFVMIIDQFEAKNLGREDSKGEEDEPDIPNSDSSSAGSSDSEEDIKNNDSYLRPLVTDDDEEYSNIYREARKAHHNKLSNSRFEEKSNRTKDTKDLTEDRDDQEKTEFYHFFAVPALTRLDKTQNSDESEEEEFIDDKSSVVKHSEPYVKSRQKLNAAINFQKSYITSTSVLTTSQIERDKTDSNSSEAEEEESIQDSNLPFGSTIQREAIGETLFDSTNLKGCAKLLLVYLFATA